MKKKRKKAAASSGRETGDSPESQTATTKGEATRAHILQTALDLFEENGYEKTTMRGIARAAGVSLGNAYYYFRSKEELIQGFYERVHQEHARACEPILATERSFKKRLLEVMLARQATAMPYHEFSTALHKVAADPRSPLNPFSDESRPTREQSIAIFREVVEGSKERFPKDLQEALPELLWLLQMGMVLYWVYDRSEGAEKSERLIHRSADLVSKLISVFKLAPLKPVRSLVLRTYREFR